MSSQPPAPYDGYAAAFAEAASDNAYNAHYDRPTVLGLLGDVAGQIVVDAGCGPGLYAAALHACGSKVIAFDQSADVIRVARSRLPGQIDIRQHDLADPLDWIPDDHADAAVLALVLHYLDDRVAALREIRRVLRPGGRLVVSTTHPFTDWKQDGGSYFDARYVEDRWDCGLLSRFWRQPLDAWLCEFTAAGFVVDRFVETRPAPSMASRHPEDHVRLSNEPGFMAIRLIKQGENMPYR